MENTWQEIRDHFLHTESLQILQIHSSMTVLLLFSSPHSFSLGFRSEDRDSHGKRLILCSVTHFCVYFDVCFGLLSCWKIKTWPIIRFLTEAVRFRFFICWYLIESMMPCIWTRCPGPPAEKQAHNIKDAAVYLTVDMGYFLSLFVLNSSGGVAAKKLFFQFHLTIEASAIWSSSRVWQLNMLEFVFGWVRRIFLETLPNNMWWFRGCLMFFFFLVSDPKTQLISAILQLWSLESLWLLKLSSSAFIRTI